MNSVSRLWPEVRYARNGRVNLAYQVVGDGPIDLVLVLGFVSHLDASWEEPRLAGFLRHLASFSRLILFDKRGCGMSDVVSQPPTIDERLGDLAAVMDAAGSRRAALFGTSEGGGVALRFAAAHPERVRAVVTFGAFARALRGAGYPWGWSDEEFRALLAELETIWLEGAELRNPTLRHDARYRRWFVRYLRLAASPGMLRDLMTANAGGDLRPLLPRLRQPALILHRVGDPWVGVDHARYLAAHIPAARLVELGGVDHWPWIGDAEEVLGQVESFLLGTKPEARRPRFGPEALTKREREVVRLTAQGYTAPEIARLLVVSERTVETHLAHAYAKLGVASRLALLREAERLGL
ncbi:MAG TPA: alpha/beta fold hydrolase [Thermomicrobiales bacterium]|nr:alpha/beta fold hydrolase [Thermomicrobiales bacterium]